MSLVLADSVKETTTTTGTGTLSLGGAPTGLRTFVAGVGNGNTTAYRIDDGLGNWEETWGQVVFGTPDSITRGTFINSSTGSRITFGAGTKTVAIVPMVELLLTPTASVGLVETDIASATTTDLGTVQTFRARITGTVTITSFGAQPNAMRFVRFAGALTLTYNATSLILKTGANRTTIAGDIGLYISDGSGNWTEIFYNSESAGTWTPSVGGSATYTTQTGTYTKIGRIVKFRCSLQVNAIGTGNASTISGLPFVSANHNPCCVTLESGLALSVYSLSAYVSGSTSTIILTGRTAAATACTDSIGVITSGTRVEIAGEYQVA